MLFLLLVRAVHGTALTSKKRLQKNLHKLGKMCDNVFTTKQILRTKPKMKEVFYKMKKKVTRKEQRTRLNNANLSCELTRVIRRFFPGLMTALRKVRDPRHQSYITYSNCAIMMTRIMSAILYISSMRKSSEELNTDISIRNIGLLCHEELIELPYWETINDYLERADPVDLQTVIHELINGLIRSRAFEAGRIRDKYWQIIIDGTQICSSEKELDGNYTYKVHNKGKENEYKEYIYYVLEAKIVLRDNIVVSIMSEFVENSQEEYQKQDCEQKASIRIMEKLKTVFPHLPICMSGDSLYACEGFFQTCIKYGWKYLVRFKKGSIPTVQQEFDSLKVLQNNQFEYMDNTYDFVTDIDYKDMKLNFVHFADNNGKIFNFLTNLSVNKKNAQRTVYYGRRRWSIENRGFNAQKQHGYYIEHLFSHKCQAMKNHYLLIQIGHMISQIMDAWEKIWEDIKISGEQRHRRLLESWKNDSIDKAFDMELKYQIRFN